MLKTMPLFVALVIFTSGCFGTSARKEALLPILRTATAGLEKAALGGIAATEGDTDNLSNQVQYFFESIRKETPTTARLAEWEAIKLLCHKGIDSWIDMGKVGENVANSLRERVVRFDVALRKYLLGKFK